MNGTLAEMHCTIDDMSPEVLGYATQALFEAGALDVYTIPVYMKKNRPGILLTCVCREADAEKFAALLLKHTTTLGVRKTVCETFALYRRIETVSTPYGPLRVKYAEGYGVTRAKAEYEDVARMARETGRSLTDMTNALTPYLHSAEEKTP